MQCDSWRIVKVLFFYQHFWPDSPPYANMLRTIGSHLSEQEHDVSVLSAEPSYKANDRKLQCQTSEVLDGIVVKRLRLLPGARAIHAIRMINKAIWPLRALATVVWDALRGQRQDVIVAATIPPVLNGWCALLAARLTGARFVYHLQDIYPEIGAVGELWSPDSLRHRLLRKLDSQTCKRATRCIVLSGDMAQALVARGVEASSIVTINNFMLAEFSNQTTTELPGSLSGKKDSGKYRVVFAGNLGRFQGLELLLEAFLGWSSDRDDVSLHFIGEGAATKTLKAMAKGSDNIFFHGHHPFEEACQMMLNCDAGVVSIQPGIYKYAYPSKTLTYLSLGLPILALVETRSELASEIESRQLGIAAANTDIGSLQAGFTALYQFLGSDANDGNRIRDITLAEHSRDAAMSRWLRLISDLNPLNAATKS